MMLDLMDYRQRVAEMYRRVRDEGGGQDVCTWFRQQRDNLFRSHSQSALSATQKAAFTGLDYYAYDPAFRVVASVDLNAEPEIFHVELGEDGRFAYQRFGQVTISLPTGTGQLSVFWIMGYGGGVFIPFGDSTNNDTTYGGGRYLYDTIKGANLGISEYRAEIVLDFNYAYNPSCAYHSRWVCPLSPAENKLNFPIAAGEMKYPLAE
jgi:uncharacterized protein